MKGQRRILDRREYVLWCSEQRRGSTCAGAGV